MGLIRRVASSPRLLALHGLKTDLVILDEQAGRTSTISDHSLRADSFEHPPDVLDRAAGVFLSGRSECPKIDITLLHDGGCAVFRGKDGPLEKQIEASPTRNAQCRGSLGCRSHANPSYAVDAELEPLAELLFLNGFGGFTQGWPRVCDHRPRRHRPGPTAAGPWTNAIGNPSCRISGYRMRRRRSWAGNSQVNRLTPWSNDPVLDPPAKFVYIRDEETGVYWTPTPRPRGQGAASPRSSTGRVTRPYEQVRDGIASELRVFDRRPSTCVKLLVLTTRNRASRERRLSAVTMPNGC